MEKSRKHVAPVIVVINIFSMDKYRILFVCIHNSARSQMAEALANNLFGDVCVAESAGIEPGTLNPLAVSAMAEMGIDISLKKTRGVFDLYTSGERYDYVVTVCDEASAERCPIFAGVTKRLHWGFVDPSSFIGDSEEKLRKTIEVRDEIQKKITEFCESLIPINEA